MFANDLETKTSMEQKFNIFMGTLLTCSRCKKAKYCSKECQKNDWKNHKRTCVEKLSEFDADVDHYIDDRGHYDEVAELELVIFQELNKCANVEAMGFPFLFPFGVGHFDCPTVTGSTTKRRFRDYRQQMLGNKRFADSVQWQAWALQTEKEMREELRKRITHRFKQVK